MQEAVMETGPSKPFFAALESGISPLYLSVTSPVMNSSVGGVESPEGTVYLGRTQDIISHWSTINAAVKDRFGAWDCTVQILLRALLLDDAAASACFIKIRPSGYR
jgi:hypothetical protein